MYDDANKVIIDVTKEMMKMMWWLSDDDNDVDVDVDEGTIKMRHLS